MTEQPDYLDLALAETTSCPDCQAPAGEHCRIQAGYPYHAARLDSARLRAAVHGTCALCGRPMVQVTRDTGVLDAFHPDPADADACPVLPDPAVDWNAYAMAVNLGQSTGRPGIEHFRPNPEPPHSAEHGPESGRPQDFNTLVEEGRRLASERDDLIAAGADPAELAIPLAPEDTGA